MGLQVTLDTTELDFDRILVKQRMSNGIKAEGAGGKICQGMFCQTLFFGLRWPMSPPCPSSGAWRREGRDSTR